MSIALNLLYNKNMSDISFNEEKSFIQEQNRSGKQSFLTRLVLKFGIARDEKGAKFILGIFALVLFSIALLFWFLGGPDTDATPSSEVLRQAREQQMLP